MSEIKLIASGTKRHSDQQVKEVITVQENVIDRKLIHQAFGINSFSETLEISCHPYRTCAIWDENPEIAKQLYNLYNTRISELIICKDDTEVLHWDVNNSENYLYFAPNIYMTYKITPIKFSMKITNTHRSHKLLDLRDQDINALTESSEKRVSRSVIIGVEFRTKYRNEGQSNYIGIKIPESYCNFEVSNSNTPTYAFEDLLFNLKDMMLSTMSYMDFCDNNPSLMSDLAILSSSRILKVTVKMENDEKCMYDRTLNDGEFRFKYKITSKRFDLSFRYIESRPLADKKNELEKMGSEASSSELETNGKSEEFKF